MRISKIRAIRSRILPALVFALASFRTLEAQDIGPRNHWTSAGAQVGYNLGGGDFTDNFQVSGRALLEILGPQDKPYAIYVLGNLSRLSAETNSENAEAKLKELQQSTQGVHLALVPHYVFGGC